MTIRPRTTKIAVATTATSSEIRLSVAPSRQLIGESWYDPRVTATNLLGEPISILRIVLATKNGTFANRATSAKSYPVAIPAGATATLDVAFDLSASVSTVFKEPGELRVIYRTPDQESTSIITIEGEH